MLKPIRMTDEATCVSLQDTAVDMEAMTEADINSYTEKAQTNPSCWRDALKIKAGESPTVFRIGVVLPGDMVQIIDDCKIGRGDSWRPNEAAWRCFLSGLRGIQGWAEEAPTIKRGNIEYVDPAWLAKTFARGLRPVAIEVGFAIFRFNQLTGDETKN